MFDLLYEYTVASHANLPEMMESVFMTVGIVTFVVSIVVAMIYYLLVNRMTDKFDQVIHWFIFLDIALVFAFVFAYAIANPYIDEGNPQFVLFWVMNTVYALVYFFVASILLKKASKFATKIPF